MKDSDDEDMSGDDRYEEVKCLTINNNIFVCLNNFHSVANFFQNNVTPNVHLVSFLPCCKSLIYVTFLTI